MPTATPISAMILDTVLKATVLLALASGAAFVLKKRSASTRHMVRSITLAALLLLPFSVMMLPEMPVKGLPGFAKSKAAFAQATPSVQAQTAATAHPAATVVTSPSSFSNDPVKSRTEQRPRL